MNAKFKHISAPLNKIAPMVLMPGDPLRAKVFAEQFLDSYELVNQQRNMLAFTGKYQGRLVTIMGSGMGMPSIGIYSHELYDVYNVAKVIRVGTCGAMKAPLKLKDIIIVDKSYSDSSYGKTAYNYKSDIACASEQLVQAAKAQALKMNLSCHVGQIYSSDVFYTHADEFKKPVEYQNCLAVEMESFALFLNAKHFQKQALTILTVSDVIYPCKAQELVLSSSDREKNILNMCRLALAL